MQTKGWHGGGLSPSAALRGTLMLLLLFAVCLGASAVGAVCGIGGGVIIKPTLDLLQFADVETISFLSGCTVLSMSLYSVSRSLLTRKRAVDRAVATPLAVGAAAGGIVGKRLFSVAGGLFSSARAIGAVQSALLFVMLVGTLVYTVNRLRIVTRRIRRPAACVSIGLALGVLSSFLGIGGGPINLAALYYFFSMPTKKAAQNSLYIILFSQITSLVSTVMSGNVPPFDPVWLILMALGGITGGYIGHAANRHIRGRTVHRLSIGLIVVILAVTAWNFLRYSAAL